QLPSGLMELNFTDALVEATSYQMSSYFTPGDPGTWTLGKSDFASSTIFGVVEYGFWLKTAASWGASGEGIVLWGFSDAQDHTSMQPLLGHNVAQGTIGIISQYDADAQMDYGYAFDIATSRIDGSVFVFTSPFINGEELQVKKGGPDLVGTPITDWRVVYSPNTIDPRPSHVSRVRCSDSGADGDLHIAYTSSDQTELRYARSLSGDGAAWITTDLEGGTFGEPAFDLDEEGHAYIVVADYSDGAGVLFLYQSLDGGQTWDPGQIVMGTSSGPSELSVNTLDALGQRIICIGYCTNNDIDESGEARVRWSADDGDTWTDQLLSTGGDAHWPDQGVARETPDFFAAWSADDPTIVYKMQARHGTFRYE
ncbi:MAG: hypothetical protein ABI743_04190, partial [bacterium]